MEGATLTPCNFLHGQLLGGDAYPGFYGMFHLQIGSKWSDVCEEIRKAHQPLLLVYTNPFAEKVDVSQVHSFYNIKVLYNSPIDVLIVILYCIL